jgi:plasmid stabilization system protein ParE
MTFRVHVSVEVYDQLVAIHDYIAADSPQNAAIVVDELLKAFDALSDIRLRHRRVGTSRSTSFPVHKQIVLSYNVYYLVDESEAVVRVLDVRHHAQRQPRGFE